MYLKGRFVTVFNTLVNMGVGRGMLALCKCMYIVLIT